MNTEIKKSFINIFKNYLNFNIIKAVISLKINIRIPNESQLKIIDILNTDFAEEYVLLTKTKMKLECSRSYNDLYKFLKVKYKLFEEMVDELAERL